MARKDWEMVVGGVEGSGDGQEDRTRMGRLGWNGLEEKTRPDERGWRGTGENKTRRSYIHSVDRGRRAGNEEAWPEEGV